MNKRNWTIWCSIWHQLIKGKQIKQIKLKGRILKLLVLLRKGIILFTEMKMDRPRMLGLRKKNSWGRNLKKLHLISLKAELRSRIELLEQENHKKGLREIQIMIVIWTLMILNLITMLTLVQIQLSTLGRSN